jgi:hypothetical protein
MRLAENLDWKGLKAAGYPSATEEDDLNVAQNTGRNMLSTSINNE